ncbi:hypothetical protein [Paraglaciecola sp. L1A13]|uniref:hypothetical protein n=1 Tax=Paraglaciecola sp. L1A13 TaxID=2686359 RepID=UPI00131E5DB4|nr:hypothetical protein [Paraglaciecola sp. L1A13]
MGGLVNLKYLSLAVSLTLPVVVYGQDFATNIQEKATHITLPPANPIPVGQIGDTVFSMPPLLWLLPALIVTLVFWTGLAWRRAWITEPMRRRRQGVRVLQRLRSDLSYNNTPSVSQLKICLRGIADSWGIAEAAPASTHVRALVLSLNGKEAEAEKWHSLWLLSERGLYSANGCPAQAWLNSFEACVGKLQPPIRVHPYPSLRKHWIPSVATMVLVMFSVPAPAAEQEEAWQQALQENSRDWAAHQNLARSMLDNNVLNPAMAHALSAFLLQSNSDTRQLLKASVASAGPGDPTLQNVFVDETFAGVPAHFSPAVWQRLAVLFALLIAIGLGVAVAGLYRKNRHYWFATGAVIAVCSISALIMSQISWSAYADLRHADAAIVLQPVNLLPEPTDLVPSEESSPLQSGAIVRVNREFLGWLQVKNAVGKQGWVRARTTMSLYGDTTD